MAGSNLEILLKLIAQAAPGSWYPRLQAHSGQVPLEVINYFLEHLYLDGLITRGAGDETTGPGVTLTSRGAEVLQDPAALERLRQGLALDPGDRGGIVREILRRPFRPVVTWTLIGLNVAVFACGLLVAVLNNLATPFLAGFLNRNMPERVSLILQHSGALDARLLIKGDWSRLLTVCFVHIGLVHLGMNMWVLRGMGRYAEQMWGQARYLTLYLLSGLGGSCLAMMISPATVEDGRVGIIQMAGASGAICGLFGAEAVWILLNGRYLPRSFVSRWRRGFVLNAGLLLFISVAPGVSGLGHLGGILVGALVALALNWQRFGPQPWRWLGIAALVPLPLLGYAGIEYARRINPTWIKLERLLELRIPDERP